MGTTVAVRPSQEVARPLKVLVPLIREELEAGTLAGLTHYRRAGEMLLEARAQVKQGEWTGWLEANFHLSHRHANRYMQLAKLDKEKRRQRPFSMTSPGATLSSIIEPDRSHHQPVWHEPVRQIANRVNVEALAREARAREQEQQMLHQLGVQLIDIGYKVLATKLHPDKGGSAEAMGRLNRVRDLLRRALP